MFTCAHVQELLVQLDVEIVYRILNSIIRSLPEAKFQLGPDKQTDLFLCSFNYLISYNRGKLPDGAKLLDADEIIKLKRCILGAKVINSLRPSSDAVLHMSRIEC